VEEKSIIALLFQLWPVFTAIIVAIGWLMFQLNSKVSKKECRDWRCDCEARQNVSMNRVEATLIDMRHEFCGRLDVISTMVLDLSNRKKEK